jgi:hypothetical protein
MRGYINTISLLIEKHFKFVKHLVSSQAFPHLEDLNYQLAIPPDNYKVDAWDKLKECERRLVVYRWAESLNDPRKADRRVTLNDAVSAFLLTFEATLQFVKDQFERTPAAPSQFEAWLRTQTQYDTLIRGLRTLRHFEAHVEQHPAGRKIIATKGAGDHSVSATWHLPQLNTTDLEKLRTHPLTDPELPDWNRLVADTRVDSLLESGIIRLGGILHLAETVV